MHLSRLWTGMPVDMKTQVNKTSEGQTGQEEPILGPDRGKRDPTQLTRGTKRETKIRLERR